MLPWAALSICNLQTPHNRLHFLFKSGAKIIIDYYFAKLFFALAVKLLHWVYSHLANALQATLQRLDVGLLLNLAIVVRIEEGRLDRFYSMDSLLDGHRIWLIHRKECNIYALLRQYVVVILGVARNVDCRASESDDIAAILTLLRVEIGMSLADVVGRNSLYRQSLEWLCHATW